MANGYNRNNNDSGEIKEIINEINQVKMLSDISAKQYADENGYADKIANLKYNITIANTMAITKYKMPTLIYVRVWILLI